MTKFKRFLSCFLALTMVLGMFSGLGAMFTVDASAAVIVGTSNVKTYEEAVTEFGSDFIYYAIDVMEYDEDGKPYLTDHYVQPGDTLQVRHYIKMSRFMGLSTFYLFYDADFFDIRNGETDLPNGAELTMNADHDAVGTDTTANSRARGMTAKYTGAEVEKNTPLINYCGFTQEELDATHKIAITTAKDTAVSTAVIVMKDDDYFGSYDIKVKEDATGTGKIHEDYRYWKASTSLTGGTPARAISDITNTLVTITDENAASTNAKASNQSGIAAENFHLDTLHEFTIGAPPAAGSTYTATFKVNGDVYDSDEYAAGASIAAPASPAMDGATFAGWAVEGTTDIVTFPATMGTADVTYVAIWKYTVTFIANGTTISTADYATGETIVFPAESEIPAVDGMSFTGWDNDTTVMGEEALTYNAVYSAITYTVTYHTDSETETLDVDYGAAYPAATISTDKEGYIFLGWYDSTLTTAMPATHTTAGNADYYAKYEKGAYTATFDADGGIFSENGSSTYTIDNIEFGAAITAPANPTKTGYTFNGWAPAVDTMDEEGKTFVAQWTANTVSVIFKDKDDSTITYGTESGIIDERIDKITDPTKEGYTFDKWVDEDGNEVVFPVTLGTEDITVYATWTAKLVYITFYNGTEYYDQIAQYVGAQMQVPATDPTSSGETFVGWVDENQDPIPATVPTADTTYYASYAAEVYTATFTYVDENGETQVWDTQKGALGSEITAPTMGNPTKTGYNFSKWVKSGSTASITFPQKMPAGGITYEAVFTVAKFTLTWVVDGDTVYTQSVNYGATISYYDPSDDIATGKTFQGWSNWYEGMTMPAEDLTITGSCDTVYYTVTYNVNGEKVGELQFAYGDTPVAYDYDVPEGHDFSGWSLPSTMPAQAITVNATLTKHTYTVKFWTYEEQGLIKSVSVAYGDTIPYPETVSVDGKDFLGWDCTDVTMPALSENGATLDITAILADHNYAIKFVDKDGAELDASTAIWNAQITEAPVTAPEVEGYDFIGWAVNDSVVTFPVTVQSDITFVATYEINTYVLKYVLDGETYSEKEYEYGAELPAEPEINKEGHTFSGWSEGTPATMPAYNLTITGTTTAIEYAAKFYQEDGTTQIGADVMTAYGTMPVAPDADVPAKEGYTHIGWTDIDSGKYYAIGQLPAMVVGGASYKAYYSAGQVNYTVVINVMGLDGVMAQESSNVYQGEADMVYTYPAQAREGFTIAADSNYVDVVISAAGDTVITVNYTRNQHTITYIVDGAEDVVTYYYGAAVEAKAVPDKEGYTNNGWDVEIPAIMGDEDIVATAQYAINTYSITFDVDGGSSVQTITAEYGADITAPADPVKEGYEFLGWLKDGEAYTIPATMPAGGAALVANWNILQFTITFETDGGTAIDPITADYGTAIGEIADPVKEGYNFLNWTPAIPATMPAQNMTITANYEVIYYPANFDIDGKIVTVQTAYGQMPEVPTNTYKLGHEFIGWDTEVVPMVVGGANYVAQYNVLDWTAEFNADGGVFAETGTDTYTVDVTFGTEITAPADPTKTGYKFNSWSPEVGTMDTEGKSFIAIWDQDLAFCRVQDVVRITENVYGITAAEYDIKVQGSPIKVQIADEAGLTWTFDRNDTPITDLVGDTGMVSITAYNADGEVIAEGSDEEVAYEIWRVVAWLAEGLHKVRVKIDTSANSWENLDTAYDYEMVYDVEPVETVMVQSAEISETTIVRGNSVNVTIKTDISVNRIRLQLTDGTTVTYTPDTSAVSYSTDGDVATWVIAIVFTYVGDADSVEQTWNVWYRVEGDSTWVQAKDTDGNDYKFDITLIRYADSTSGDEGGEEGGYDAFSVISVTPETATPVKAQYTAITIVTTDDVTKVRLVSGTRSSTFLATSKNVTTTTDGAEEGTMIWTINYRFAATGEQTWNVLCRGNAWSEATEASTFTVDVQAAA